jgi:DNA-directed RNA polymerase alpha subunit
MANRITLGLRAAASDENAMTVEENARFRVPVTVESSEGQISPNTKFQFASPRSPSSPIRDWFERRRVENVYEDDGLGYELSEVQRRCDA